MGSPEVVRIRPTSEDGLRELGRWAAELVVTLGAEVLGELARFSRATGPGAMITIRRTRDGFTAQVTGAIVSGRVTTLDVDSIGAIAAVIDGSHLDAEPKEWHGSRVVEEIEGDEETAKE